MGNVMGTLSARIRDYAFVAMACFIILVGAAMVGLLYQNVSVLRESQALQLQASRAVVRCSLEQELRTLERIGRELGLTIDIRAPSTEGIDCKEILQKPLGGTGR